MIDNKILEEIVSNLEILKYEGDVVEVRMINTKKRTVSGYFDDYDILAKEVANYIGENDIYITLNPVKESLLARCKNRLQPYAKKTSSDGDIERLNFILIDLDPVRPSGISATDEEKAAALELLETIQEELQKENFPKPVVADSGNGYHLLYLIDLENTPENVETIKEFLEALDFLYSTDKVVVDRTTFNPSRIVKLYGTIACKGDHTDDRPHRWADIIETPGEIEAVDIDMIKKIVAKNPKIEEPKSKSNGKKNSKIINIENFIEKHGLDLAYKGDFKNIGTKYILRTCPWNGEHVDNSAYIIQFNNGALAAGCKHNSCSGENWKSLKKLLKEDKSPVIIDPDEKESDILIKLCESFQSFINELEEPFVAVNNNGHFEVMDVKSAKFKSYLLKLYYDNLGSYPSENSINQAVKVLEMKSTFSKTSRKLERRVAMQNNTFYYDLCDPKWRAVRIDANGCKIENNPPILFLRKKNMREQMLPDLSAKPQELIKLVKKYFRFKRELDSVLFTTYLASCCIPEIAHVILVIYGEKGAAKSTTMRMIKRLIDPAMNDLLSMPTSESDLAITLANNYMPCFDNLETLSANKSNLLCLAATGGSFTKRKLYTDSEEIILNLKRCVTLNGINIVASRADLLDRSIVLELERIPKNERMTEREIWENFEKDIPKFLGAIFNTISLAISLYQKKKLQEVGRMADFTYWGYAIAEVLGFGGDKFIKSYLANQDAANEEALSSNPVAAAVIELMKGHRIWTGSVSELLANLEKIAEKVKINTRVKLWAKDANVLSRRINEVKSNLEEIGIYYNIKHAGNFKRVTIEKRSGEENINGALKTYNHKDKNSKIIRSSGRRIAKKPASMFEKLGLEENDSECEVS